MCAKSGTQILFDLRLNTESETHTIRVGGADVAGVAAAEHTPEVVSVSRIRRTQPPDSGTG